MIIWNQLRIYLKVGWSHLLKKVNLGKINLEKARKAFHNDFDNGDSMFKWEEDRLEVDYSLHAC